jgi:hypothetical protein
VVWPHESPQGEDDRGGRGRIGCAGQDAHTGWPGTVFCKFYGTRWLFIALFFAEATGDAFKVDSAEVMFARAVRLAFEARCQILGGTAYDVSGIG